MKSVIILGTSRNQGNTAHLTQYIATQINAEVIDLATYHIQPYDYEHNNQDDDFATLIQHLLGYDQWIFASPIYWYSPSATMKLFLDRMCDLIEVDKSRGRALKDKFSRVIATGAAEQADDGFEAIFSQTSSYFAMQYQGMLYCRCQSSFEVDKHNEAIEQFTQQLQ
ncbi:FMN reductase [Saccharobesus litoralis]|uniref:FMN reductase n=1 Tax=Saccharobesus litoralis TaxID=2172099 RepID=A0A2S0VNV9_9ALTE|nr:flavodoxin family protein [Saccharobesus litoralis]AWB65872.1 FMN reductase [Saccharobesus litoralis]